MYIFIEKKSLAEFTGFGLNSFILVLLVYYYYSLYCFYVLYTVFLSLKAHCFNDVGSTYPMALFDDPHKCRFCQIAFMTINSTWPQGIHRQILPGNPHDNISSHLHLKSLIISLYLTDLLGDVPRYKCFGSTPKWVICHILSKWQTYTWPCLPLLRPCRP